jgi:hypothetical protein
VLCIKGETKRRRVLVELGVECELRSMHVRGLLSPFPLPRLPQLSLLKCCPAELTGDQWS